jgi:hypothetical protein
MTPQLLQCALKALEHKATTDATAYGRFNSTVLQGHREYQQESTNNLNTTLNVCVSVCVYSIGRFR